MQKISRHLSKMAKLESFLFGLTDFIEIPNLKIKDSADFLRMAPQALSDLFSLFLPNIFLNLLVDYCMVPSLCFQGTIVHDSDLRHNITSVVCH